MSAVTGMDEHSQVWMNTVEGVDEQSKVWMSTSDLTSVVCIAHSGLPPQAFFMPVSNRIQNILHGCFQLLIEGP